MKPQDMQTLALAALTAARPSRIPAVTPLGAKVDRLGIIRAQLDKLATEADEIRTELEAAALPAIEGTFYRVSFSTHAGASRTDWQAIARKLGASPQIIRANTKKGADSVHMKLTAKIVKH